MQIEKNSFKWTRPLANMALFCLVSIFGWLGGNDVWGQDKSGNRHLRAEWFSHDDSGELNPQEIYDLFERAKARIFDNKVNVSPIPEWDSLGPKDVILDNGRRLGRLGRVSVVAIDPSNPKRLYAGTGSGGMWTSADDGDNWSNMTVRQNLVSISGIVVDQDDPDVIYVLTGDGDASTAPVSPVRPSIGVLKTVNGGRVWKRTGLEQKQIGLKSYGFKLVMDPTDHRVLFAVMSSGLFRTANGGKTWRKVLNGAMRDFEFRPSRPATAAGAKPCAVVDTYAYASTTEEVYIGTQEGTVWEVADISPVGRPDLRRVALAVSAKDPQLVYALFAGSDGFAGLYRSEDCGQSFALPSLS